MAEHMLALAARRQEKTCWCGKRVPEAQMIAIDKPVIAVKRV
jgi:hypothetical protein